MKRAFRHLFAPSLRKVFPQSSLDEITQAIAESEQHHSGQIVFAVDTRLHLDDVFHETSARVFAKKAFARLCVWNTEHNNGVLIYLLIADRQMEIVADRGFNGKVSSEEWQGVCAAMRPLLAQKQYKEAVLEGIRETSRLIEREFPRNENEPVENELPNTPEIL
jgi:uncharacterized membrane protein